MAEKTGGERRPAAERHTYLARPGLWTIDGIYFDRDENHHHQSGQLVIVHGPDLWTIESELTISGEDTRDFLSRYEITPMAPGASQTEWKSETGGPEPVFGLFVIVEDAVMSPWQSRSGSFWGHETLVKISDDLYLSRGFAFLKRDKVSAWAVKYSRQGASGDSGGSPQKGGSSGAVGSSGSSGGAAGSGGSSSDVSGSGGSSGEAAGSGSPSGDAEGPGKPSSGSDTGGA